MADDVKVKFGGDFSDLSKGASDAAAKAGTAMTGWLSDFGNSLKKSFASAFSADNVISTFASNMREHMGKMNELDILSRSLGVNVEELQKFAEMGKLAGLSQDQMGKALQNANRLLAQSAVGNKGSQEALRQMGFTQEQVISKQIKALDIVYKLGEGFKKNGNEVVTAAKAQAAFGESGAQMVDIMRQGNDVIRDRIRLMQLYTEEQVRTAARAKVITDRGKEKLDYILGGFASENIGRAESEARVREASAATNKAFGFESEQDMKKRFDTEAGFKSKYLEKLAAESASRGVGLSELASTIEGTFGRTQGGVVNDPYTVLLGIRAMQNEEAYQKQQQLGKSRFVSEATPVLAASSLQQIGGGDVASVMSGLYIGSIEDNTKRTADATEKLANKSDNVTPSRATIINKAK